MEWMHLHNMEYGECVVLGSARQEILMVDCGSMNQKIREGDLPVTSYIHSSVMPRYASCKSRSFLLTHFHRDHLCGLFDILEKDSAYFDRIYLPVAPRNAAGQALLLEFALFVFAFMGHSSYYSQGNISALKIFNRLAKQTGAERLFPIGAEDCFVFDGVSYEVLWPEKEAYPFSELFTSVVEDLNICVSSPYLPESARIFMDLKEQFCKAYMDLCKNAPVKEEKLQRLSRLLARLELLIPQLNTLPCTPDILQILEGEAAQTAYSDELNAASVIFHNCRTQEASLNDLLMTGDAAPESLEAVRERLYPAYYIVKAPHHGTVSHWSRLIEELSPSHILISNGEYAQGGKIAQEYVDLPAMKHCTNAAVCPWQQASGSSCNRLAYCYDIPTGARFAMKCPHYSLGQHVPCAIQIVSAFRESGCLCDVIPQN